MTRPGFCGALQTISGFVTDFQNSRPEQFPLTHTHTHTHTHTNHAFFPCRTKVHPQQQAGSWLLCPSPRASGQPADSCRGPGFCCPQKLQFLLISCSETQDLRAETPLGDLWHHDFWGNQLSSNTSHKSYRPLTVLVFRMNCYLSGGFHPLSFHVVNILLHSGISILLVDVFSVLFGGLQYTSKGRRLNLAPRSSLLAALLFAVHPVHTECVAAVVGCADLLAALFFLLSFLGYCKALRETNKEGTQSMFWVLLSILLGAVAMLCKEQGITVLGLNAVFDILVIGKLNVLELVRKVLHKDRSLENTGVLRTEGLLFRMSLLALGGTGVLYVRWKIMGTGPPAFTEVDNPASFASSMLVRAINYNYYYSLNAWLLLCPWWLCFDWSMGCIPLIKSVGDWRVIALAALWFCLIGLICQALCSEDSHKRRILTLGLGLLIIPFLPASNLFFRVGFVVAERVLYLPSAGYCMLLTFGFGVLSKHTKKKKLIAAFVLGILFINTLRCVIRSGEWRNEEQLFRSALSVCPLNAKVHYNVGKNLADKGNQTAAIRYYREAVRLNPKYVHAMNNLGNILKERNELQEAEELLSLAVQIQPDFAAAWMNLGIVQNSLKRFQAAEQSYRTAIKHRRKYPDCYYNLGRLEIGKSWIIWDTLLTLENYGNSDWRQFILQGLIASGRIHSGKPKPC
ncbi:protein O-mannosyl-transferase TMTC4 isoform X5 [Sagmatias obliquidens]|uniref:protein O-mannosyl-transferase TMTC4 isoform X5 n=1 Tax=Sagmatias obliquidens TaxID=3371155 RepID=UPI000F442037|nr:transmembrane and TPR repeat-containing protein 4 isoform X5 [Lagenorhynchus obliquidens]